MKKALIAGAASAVLAAMPVAGVFAVGNGETITDNFQVTIERTCAMTRKSSAEHTDGYDDTEWTTSGTTDTMNINTITSGAVYSLGSSTFNVICNGTNGYNVKSVITNFTNAAGDEIALGNTALGDTAPTTASVWTVHNGTSLITNNGATVVKSKNSATTNAGDDFTMTYKLGLKDGQASGTYTANIAYTLYDLTDN